MAAPEAARDPAVVVARWQGQREPARRQVDGPAATRSDQWKNYLGVFRYTRRAIALVWSTNRALTIGLALGSLLAGVLPGAIAWVGKHLIDAIVLAARTHDGEHRWAAMEWVGIELGLVIALAVTSRLLGMMRSLLRQQLGHRINVEILEKALTLDLTQFEDSELYDSLTRARREASSRPLSLVSQTFELAQGIGGLGKIGIGPDNLFIHMTGQLEGGAGRRFTT